ncbi:SDR family NAD(P)-dependent oxidoreductase [Marinivivus vitaminiproducens]|uniref:SDR family NAD(P)-dependent oxidoreductase n=1 Tax=Marinivivus vitaminiproducens TaxID=3035935 RepID=UPI0027A624FB|nr:SDR family oxidoreductase [Geminicoccaceae bacterium SCSIO 64248]
MMQQQVSRDALADKVALVTGGGSGIGACTATQLGELGATIVVAGRREAPLNAVVSEIVEAGGIAWAHPVDVTEEAAVDDLVSAVTDRFGGLHLAVNCAGDGHMSELVETEAASFDHVMRVNAYGTFYTMRAELRAIEASGGGAIVNVSSTAGVRGFPHLSAYCAAKHAVVGMTRSVALEAAGRGVRVNAVAPGTTATELLDRLPSDARQAMADACTLQRLGRPEEIAESIVYLLTRASYSTGLILAVDGGSPYS